MFQLPHVPRGSRSARGRQPVPQAWREPRPTGDRRWADRALVHMEAQFRPRWHPGSSVRVENLSSFGCGISGPGQLVVGGYSWIILPTLESQYARIAWSDGSAAGLDFADPLHVSVTDMIVKRAACS